MVVKYLYVSLAVGLLLKRGLLCHSALAACEVVLSMIWYDKIVYAGSCNTSYYLVIMFVIDNNMS